MRTIRSFMVLVMVAGIAIANRSYEAEGQTTNAWPGTGTNVVANVNGPIAAVAGDVTQTALTWIAQHGSAGVEYCGPVVGGKAGGGSGPAATQTAWFFDLPWTTKGATNIDNRLGLLHADVFAKDETRDQLGLELDETFFNGNIALTVEKWPVIGPVWRAAAKLDIDVTGSIAHNTDSMANGRFAAKNMDWGVGTKVIKLF